MFGRMRLRPLKACLTVGFQLAFASVALAHHPTIDAVAVCVDGKPVVNYTSTSWSPNPLEGENTRIDIYFDTVPIASGAYVYPANAFSGSAPAPSASSVIVSALAVDNWGNGNPGGQYESKTVAIPAECAQSGTGRFTGGGSQIKVGGARVTRGLTVHCDLLLSNNLEINWGGNKFHMTEHMTTVRCSDDPFITQAPPAAPLDTMVGVGTGRYNNVDGYTVEFTFVDYGEPGSSDRAALKVYRTSNPSQVVLNIPLQVLEGGNLQAHYDQPHK
jgi:hypothetical protein